jgi:hypothetical protein
MQTNWAAPGIRDMLCLKTSSKCLLSAALPSLTAVSVVRQGCGLSAGHALSLFSTCSAWASAYQQPGGLKAGISSGMGVWLISFQPLLQHCISSLLTSV